MPRPGRDALLTRGRTAQRSARERATKKYQTAIRTTQQHAFEYDEMKAVLSKTIINEIGALLAKHYGFTAEELDFIVNYDIKYRLGAEEANGDEG